MGAIFPRRQAARLSALLHRHFTPGLTIVEGPSRSGRSDLLRQVFDGLAREHGNARGTAPALLALSGRPMGAGAAQSITAQLLAFREGQPATPNAAMDRERMLARGDADAWLALAGTASETTAVFHALAAFAERTGPVCLLLDDAPAGLLRAAAAAVRGGALAVVAVSAHGEEPIFFGGHTIAIEAFTVREGVLLAEGLARAMGVDFSGAAAEPFAQYCHADAFVLDTVVRAAALHSTSLTSGDTFARLYLEELSGGMLAAWLRGMLPGAPGEAERRFALEVVAGGMIDAPLLRRWRPRADVEGMLGLLRRGGWILPRGDGWQVRDWPAARDWAMLETGGAHAAGALTLRLLAGLETAARSHADGQVAARITAAMGAMTPAAAGFLAENGVAGATVPVVCRVERQPAPCADFYLCYGFRDGRRKIEDSALLAVAVAEPAAAGTASILEALDERSRDAAAALPAADAPPPAEKWLVMRQPASADADAARRSGVRLIERELFNRLIQFVSGSGPAEQAAEAADVIVQLPMAADYEIAVVRVLDHLLERQGCDKRAASQARIALVEACLNAIEHGRAIHLDPAVARMEIRLRLSAGTLEMAVTNPGPPFQPEEDPAGAFGSALHRGHGLKIIRSLMDRVTISSDLNGTTVAMTKRLPAASERPGGANPAGESSPTEPQRASGSGWNEMEKV